MLFNEFAKRLAANIGLGDNQSRFARTLFETIIDDTHLNLVSEKKSDVYKAYFNGSTSINRISKEIVAFIEPENFAEYIDNFPDPVIENLCISFQDVCPDIDNRNCGERLAYLFRDIIVEAAQTRRKGKSKATAEDEIKMPSPTVDEGKTVLLSETDKVLLSEFTDDYDDIVLKCLSQNYAGYLLDGIIITQISNLYNTKWKAKANEIESLSLKPYIWGMLSHLNELCDYYNGVPSVKPPLRQTRDKLRNLYVKLHPEQYANSFLYDAIMDDWISGEDY